MFTFNDPKVIRTLQNDFIPVAGNIAELAWSRTGASRWFMSTAGKVNYRVRSGQTVQGFYTVAADGTAYGFENVRDAKVVIRMLTEARDAFHAHPPIQLAISTEGSEGVFSRSPDPTVSVVRVYTRVRPVPLAANSLNKSVGRDHLWIIGSDVKAIIAAGANGSGFKMPDALAGRIVRYHLVDNVRGEPDMWLAGQVKRADFTMKPLGKSKGKLLYSFRGAFTQKLSDGSRGLGGTIRGEMDLDAANNRVIRFRAYAEAQAWGDSKFTKWAPPGKFPMVIAMIESTDNIAMNVPPEALGLDDEYFFPTAPVLDR
ncbi:MAG: hypothetical protein ACR2HJ_01500 [Fimbriimonadales bacterium]